MTTARAPLRLSLAGGGSDLPEYYTAHGGRLVAAGLNMHVEVSVAGRAGGVVVDDDSVVQVARAAELPPSLVRCALLRFGIDTGVAVRVRSECPSGTGLGWSGALAVALVAALGAWCGSPLCPADAAALAFVLERDDLGRPVGQQDQWVAAFGGVIHLAISRRGEVEARRDAELEEALSALLDRALLLFRTPIRRAAADLLARQAGQFTSSSERSATARTGMAAITDLVDPFSRALREHRVADMGRLLHEHWLAKVRVAPWVTNPEIDRWYSAARAAGGYGGKIVGAGGGGHLLVVCGADAATAVESALREAGLARVPLGLDLAGVQVRPDGNRPHPSGGDTDG